MRAGVCAHACDRPDVCAVVACRPAVVGQEGWAGARGCVNHYRILCACSSYLRSFGLYTMMGLVGSTCTMRSMPAKIVLNENINRKIYSTYIKYRGLTIWENSNGADVIV